MGLICKRLKQEEKRLDFPGEIFKFQHTKMPWLTFVAEIVFSSFQNHIGGLHTDEMQSIYPQGWKSLKEMVEKISRKARDMRNKNLMHDLDWGGNKFGQASEKKLMLIDRFDAFKFFGELLNHLTEKVYKGEKKIFTGADVNTTTFDLMVSATISPYVLGLPPEYGGSGDPSPFTAFGTYGALERGIKVFFNTDTIRGKRINIKGIGKVGWPVLEMCYKAGANIGIADINPALANFARHRFPGVETVPEKEIHAQFCHVYCPCDKTITITEETEPEIAAKLIIGAANDQCPNIKLADKLFERDIIWPTDFLPNGGGVTAVVKAHEGLNQKETEAHIQKTVIDQSEQIMLECKETNVAPHYIVGRIIEEKARATNNELWRFKKTA